MRNPNVTEENHPRTWKRNKQFTQALIAGVALACIIPLPASSQRPLTLDDVLAIESVTDAAIDVKGNRAAVVVQRAINARPFYRPYSMFGNDAADIWMVQLGSGSATNLSLGAEDGTGWWNPQWSPDGQHLAMLSTTGGDNVRLYVANLESGKRSRLSSRGVDTRFEVYSATQSAPFTWLDSRRILVALLPAGMAPREFSIRRMTPDSATSAWTRTRQGRIPTASVLRSPVEIARLPTTLQIIDVVSGTANTLLDRTMSHASVSPSGRQVAVWGTGAQDSTLISVVGIGDSGVEARVVAGAVTNIVWSGDHASLLLRSSDGTWNRVDSRLQGAPTPVSFGLALAPTEIVGAADRLFAIAGGDLWDVTLVAEPRALSAALQDSIQSVAGSDDQALILRVRNGSASHLIRFDIARQTFREVPQPAGRARALDVQAMTGEALFVENTASETVVWHGRAGSPALKSVLRKNEWLLEVATAERRLIRYTSAAGDTLRAMVLLPIGYRAGVRYPAVVWVYPGILVRDTLDLALDFWAAKNHSHPDNLQLLTALGYVVLMPSIPAGTIPREPYAELSSGVLGAVDSLVRSGLVDSARIAVMGQSGGGFATMGLVTQTDRFRTAIAIAGISDMLSNYGTFSGEARYGASAVTPGAAFLEGPVFGLGAPPWKDMDRYVRNSPLTHAGRVQTPILIIHGDLDYVPMQQAEEFFTALSRAGKRVEFVRYWGESHGATDSMANLRDRWTRIAAWLRAHLH